jgi:hypothetical protein
VIAAARKRCCLDRHPSESERFLNLCATSCRDPWVFSLFFADHRKWFFLGRRKYLVFYFACDMAASVTHVVFNRYPPCLSLALREQSLACSDATRASFASRAWSS